MIQRSKLAVCGWLLASLFASTPAQASLSDDDLAALRSRYERERREAVRLMVERGAAEETLIPLLEHADPRVRSGAATVMAEVATSERGPAALRAAFERETDRFVKGVLAERLCAAICRGGARDTRLIGADPEPVLLRAAERLVRREIERMFEGGTVWSNYRSLTRFVPLGRCAERALIELVRDETAVLGQRCLAAMALGRLDAREFWLAADGGIEPRLRKLLNESEPDLKAALFYAAACHGPDGSAELVRQAARFAMEDAFGENVIQSALYFLYTLPQPAIGFAPRGLAACANEFIDPFHSQKVHYNAGELLKRIEAPAVAKKAIDVLMEAPSFAGYWLFVGIMTNLARLPAEEAEPLARRLIDWGLADEQPVPHLRGLAWWYYRDRYGEDPDGVDRDALLAAIRESTAKTHSRDDDPDNYAQRSGLEILALLEDPEATALIRRHLSHESEAVRMAAAIAAGNGGCRELIPDLVDLMNEHEEFAGFGAAYGLKLLGDESGRDFFVAMLGSGNLVLAAPSLINLREMTKHVVDDAMPETQAGWRRRQEAWRKYLAGTGE